MTTYRAGSYIACSACGRLLRIEWATRSIVCSCGARITPPPRDGAESPAGPPKPKGKP